jgi:hypothetical protein
LVFSKEKFDLLAGISRCLWQLGGLPNTLVGSLAGLFVEVIFGVSDVFEPELQDGTVEEGLGFMLRQSGLQRSVRMYVLTRYHERPQTRHVVGDRRSATPSASDAPSAADRRARVAERRSVDRRAPPASLQGHRGAPIRRST